jgi:hypothetical protein
MLCRHLPRFMRSLKKYVFPPLYSGCRQVMPLKASFCGCLNGPRGARPFMPKVVAFLLFFLFRGVINRLFHTRNRIVVGRECMCKMWKVRAIRSAIRCCCCCCCCCCSGFVPTNDKKLAPVTRFIAQRLNSWLRRNRKAWILKKVDKNNRTYSRGTVH